ncbi:hypothetical protein ACOMHN_004686 [Nucella lapillus]
MPVVVCLYRMLTTKRHLTSVDPEHNDTLLHVLRILLLDHMPDLRPEDFSCPRLMLRAHRRAYRGQPIHVAVALRRLNVVRELLSITREGGMDVCEQLQVTDGCHNSAISLAVRMYDCEAVTYLISRLDQYPVYTKKFILRHCFVKNIPRLVFCRNSELNNVLEKVFHALLNLNADFEHSHLILLWYLYLTDEASVRNVLRQDNVYNYALLEPNPFHFAASVSCNKEFGIVDVNIFRNLASHIHDNHWMEPNAISTMKIGAKECMNGTAAHFAVLNYQPAHLMQMHPGYVNGDTLNTLPTSRRFSSPSRQIRLTHSGRPVSISRLLEYLWDSHDTDLLKPNHEQKTPLDCLPPDADPELIRTLVTLQRL